MTISDRLRRLKTVLLMLTLVPTVTLAQETNAHFHWRPASTDARPRPWAILLPGASGLNILGDDGHYFRFAGWLNERGMDVLIVHYQQATKALPDTRKGPPGVRMAKIVAHAVDDARKRGRLDVRCGGVVVGWSLGGEGMWTLAGGSTPPLEGLAGGIGYYPSVRGQAKQYIARMPVFVLQGMADSITTPKALDRFLATAGPQALIEVHRYAGATHGFDVASLGGGTSVRGTRLAFDATGDAEAKARIASWLDRVLTPAGAACPSGGTVVTP